MRLRRLTDRAVSPLRHNVRVTLLGVIFGGLAVLVAVVAWLWPRPSQTRRESHETVRVEVNNSFPVFDRPSGAQEVGEHYVGVTLRNGSPSPVKVVAWGVSLPGDRRVVLQRPSTAWEPRLPHWVPSSDSATWFMEAAELRNVALAQAIDFKKMIAYVQLADGREIRASRGVPLA